MKKKKVKQDLVTMKVTKEALSNFREAAGNSEKRLWEIALEGSQFMAGKYKKYPPLSTKK